MSLMNMYMFWVCKGLFRRRGTQRRTQCILKQGRTTHEKKNGALQANNCPKTGTDSHLIKVVVQFD